MTGKLLAACLLLAAASARAAGYAGADPFEFLRREAGARQAALGGAFAAGRDDPDVLVYNPAGLASIEGTKFKYTATDHFAGVEQKHFSFASARGLGLYYDFLDFGTIRRTTLSDPSGAGLSDFSASALTLGAGVGFSAAPEWDAGAGLKYFRQDIDDARAGGWALDLGVQGLVFDEPRIRVAGAVQNAGPKVRFAAKKEPLPLNFKLGAGTSFPVLGRPVAAAADVNHVPQGRVTPHVGVAAQLTDRFVFMLGFNGRNKAGSGFAWGIGLQLRKVSFEFSLTPFGELGSSSKFSFGYRWGE